MAHIKIKQVPQWLIWLGIFPKTANLGLAPYIFLCKELFEDYKKGTPNCKTKAMIAHESVHVERQKTIGLLKFLYLYRYSKQFCLNEEIKAIKEEMRIYKSCSKKFNIEHRAKSLSTFWVYRNCINYEDAEKLLADLWQQTS